MNQFLNKNIAKFTLDVNPETVALSATTVGLTSNTIVVANSYSLGEKVALYGADVPAGSAIDTQYFVIPMGNGKIKLASSLANAIAGTAVDLTDVGSGNMIIGRSAFGVTTLGKLPENAVVTNVLYDVETTFTSATDAATIALDLGGTDFVAALAISNGTNIWDAGVHGTLYGNWALDGNALTAIAMAAARTGTYTKTTSTASTQVVESTIAVETLTAGKLNIYVEYFVSD